MNKKLIEEYKLNGAIKRFNQLNEYTFMTSTPPLSEDGEEDSDGTQDLQAPNIDADANTNSSMGMDHNPDGEMQLNPPQRNNNNQLMGNQNDSTQQPMSMVSNNGNGTEMNNAAMASTENGEEDDDFNVETEEMQPSDEVIDVDELTTSQEATEYKLDDTNNKLTTLLKAVNRFITAIEQNDHKIEDLKSEFEKRNPTPEERLNLRSQSSYPYSEAPKDYWDKKREENPHYNIMYDNDVSANKEQEKFEIRKKDLEHINYNEIAKSFDEPLKLNNFINF